MSRLKYKEEQRLPKKDLALVVVLFVAIIAIGGVQMLSGELRGTGQLWMWLVVAGVMVTILWYLRSLRMCVRVNHKNVKVGCGLFQHDQRKIKWKHVDKIELIRLPKLYKWRGWNVHYSAGNKWYNLNGRAVLKLTMTDGRDVLIGCMEMEEMQDALLQFERTRDILVST